MDGFERVIRLDCLSRDELGNPARISLLVELTGRHSNLVLINDNGVIIDAIKRVPFGSPSSRPVFPGIQYSTPPAQDKVSPLELSGDLLEEQGSLSAKAVPSFLSAMVQGMSQLLAREVAYQFTPLCSNAKDVCLEQWQRIAQFLSKLAKRCRGNESMPQGYLIRSEGNLYFHVIPLTHLGEAEVIEGINQTVQEAILHSTTSKDLEKARASLRKRTNVLLQKIERLIIGLKEDLAATENKDKDKRYGELLYASIGQHTIKGETAIVTDYYDPELATVAVPVNPKLSLADNARLYFRRYNKAVGTESHSTARLQTAMEQQDYLQGLLYSIDSAQDRATLDEIEQEMREEGLLKTKRTSPKTKAVSEASGPLAFTSPDGLKVSVGRNNLQNNDLVKAARASDIWLHVQKAPGSHCLIHVNGPVPDSTLLFATNLAAWFSSLRESSSIPVDYTERRHVRRPSGAKPGYVIYDNQKTFILKKAEEPVRG